MKLGMNHPMGPLALADLIGLDVCLSIMEVLHEGFGDSKYRPCPLLQEDGGGRLPGPEDRQGLLRIRGEEEGAHGLRERRCWRRPSAVYTLTVNRPKALNALNLATLDEIGVAAAEVGPGP